MIIVLSFISYFILDSSEKKKCSSDSTEFKFLLPVIWPPSNSQLKRQSTIKYLRASSLIKSRTQEIIKISYCFACNIVYKLTVVLTVVVLKLIGLKLAFLVEKILFWNIMSLSVLHFNFSDRFNLRKLRKWLSKSHEILNI